MSLGLFSLEGKVAFITGASYGIGFAIAKAYAAAGARIVFNDISRELVDRGLAAYREAGIPTDGYVCDVTDEKAVHETVARIEKEVGVIGILVNNAGIIKRIPMLEMAAAVYGPTPGSSLQPAASRGSAPPRATTVWAAFCRLRARE